LEVNFRNWPTTSILGDLVVPPGNRLEALRGDIVGKHSIRINDQCESNFGGVTTGRKRSRS
jgi:hypothetical protein